MYHVQDLVAEDVRASMIVLLVQIVLDVNIATRTEECVGYVAMAKIQITSRNQIAQNQHH